MRAYVAIVILALLAGPLVAEEGTPTANPALDPTTPVAGDPAAYRAIRPEQPPAVLVRGATIWTSGPAGTLENADLLIEDGVVRAVGSDLDAPDGALVIDGTGKHVTAGLIDCHSHSAIVGGVNEATHTVTAEVRLENLVDAESMNVYWQLAGGLTTANLLHGSANAIGGQNAVIKLRWGASPRDMLFAEAPAGVKFALGENPKQANWNVDERRYPQTRQGVEQAIREAFLAARDYQRAHEEHVAAGRDTVPPRRDLQLEAITEMLSGERLIHSHAYRADEMLMLMALTESFGTKVASFQHVLEGYKIADELAAHGAGASTFSDWWAYKFEVIDAIPHNGAIMHRRDVSVSFNSDDAELATRLNLEAAKAVRYGGVAEDEALTFVTLQPAKQLGIDRWVGSLEPGKHADFVVWSGHPLSTYSIALETWIDGRKYFDRAADLAGRDALAAERRALIEQVRAEQGADDEDEDEGDADDQPDKDETDEPPTPPEAAGHHHGPHAARAATQEDQR